jgi:hypothetical protein
VSDQAQRFSKESLLVRLMAERATDDPAYLGWALRAYAEVERESLSKVIASLGVQSTERDHFVVCLRPSGDRFAESTRLIANRFNIDTASLAALLRHVEVLSAFDQGGSVSTDGGALLAARMRKEGANELAEREEPYSIDKETDETDEG